MCNKVVQIFTFWEHFSVCLPHRLVVCDMLDRALCLHFLILESRHEIYYLGLMDVLMHYGASKKAKEAAKTVKHGVSYLSYGSVFYFNQISWNERLFHNKFIFLLVWNRTHICFSNVRSTFMLLDMKYRKEFILFFILYIIYIFQ